MPAVRYFSPEDTIEQKLQIERRLGCVKARKYFNILERFLSCKVSKREFDGICIAIIGRENVPLHNHFLKSILKKACFSKTAVPRENKVEGSLNVKTPNGCNNLQLLCKDFPQSPRRGRTPNLRDRRFRDRPSPLGPPHGKNISIGCEDSTPKIHEQQSNIHLQSVRNRLPLFVEDGDDEVDQVSEILNLYKRSPIQAPLAIPTYNRRPQKYLCKGQSSFGTVSDTCQSTGQLPDIFSLTKRLEQKLDMEGLKISMDAANLLNNALDVYLKRLIKPCLDLAASKLVNKFSGPIQRRSVQRPTGSVSASISDFRTAVEVNPIVLGEDWSLNLEKLCLRTLEE